MQPRNPSPRHQRTRSALASVVVSVWLAGCFVYDADRLRGTRANDDEITAADSATPRDCDGDCEIAQSDTSVPESECEADAAAHGCEATGDVPEPGHQTSEDDQCPNDPNKQQPGTCGCGQPDSDSDGDGTLDCEDGCPRDPAKTAALICGCGTPDSDTDADRTADCVDACPRDAAKTSVGTCGCGVLDVDRDGDGTADCVDMCPDDPAKTSPGVCGCGSLDPTTLEHAEAFCTKRWLLHRYSFEGGETFASDRVGNAHASIVAGDALSTPGALTMSGDVGAANDGETYVALPQNAWPQGDSATFEAWVTWKGAAASGTAAWQRVFDFGDQRGGKGRSFVSLTPQGDRGVRATFTVAGSEREVFVATDSPLPLNVVKHLAVVVDGASGVLSLYIDGRAQGSVRLPDKLSNIAPVNRWLGRSNYDVDPAFFGSLHEFRIYGAALSEAQLYASYAAGADYTFAR